MISMVSMCWSGAVVTASSTRTKRSANAWADVRSNRSVLKSNAPLIPSGRRSPSKASAKPNERSNFEADRWTLLVRDVQPGKFGDLGRRTFVVRVVEGEHDLEEGVVGEGAGGVEGFDEAFEGEVLVGVGGEVGLPYAVEELAEGGVAAGVGA